MERSATKGPHHWIPASFALVAGMLVYHAAARGGAAWALLWPAADCAAVAAAYYGLGARVFGKRPDGSRRPLVAFLMLPFGAVQYLTWRLQVLLSPEGVFGEAAPGVFVGRRPLPGEHPPGVSLVVDLTAEFAKPAYHPDGAGYLALPTVDGFVPDAAAFRAALDAAAGAGSVFVHCANGHGRGAMFASALLVRKGLAKDVDEAMARVRAARPACRLTPAQRAAAQRAAL